MSTDESENPLIELLLLKLKLAGVNAYLLNELELFEEFTKFLPIRGKSFPGLENFDNVAFSYLGVDARRYDLLDVAYQVGHTCIIPHLTQELLATAKYFLGNSGSTFSMAVQWIRTYRMKIPINSTLMLGGFMLNKDEY